MEITQNSRSTEATDSSRDKKDWRKFVLINPINVTFKESKDDGKGTSQLEILNKSDNYILYKVKTTEPNNYIVRPN